ncbi:MAG: hypothetical protein SF052_25185 [Bacteroidia bacterium]|nr:hypothetical protein [Bacteroidia bacterium]
MSINRYPGAQPFSADQNQVFFGRKNETERLHRLVRLEPLVAIYAKSGMGKSSLINAGLLPAIRREGIYQPLTIRLGPWTPDKQENPLEITLQHILTAVSAEGHDPLSSLAGMENSLWQILKTAQAQNKRPFLLVFDQFEELFTYPAEAISDFGAGLSEVLFTRIPQRIREKLETQLEEDPDSVEEKTIELPPLDENAARQAILEPAQSREEGFSSPRFTYSPEALNRLIAYLTEDGSQRIESTQLQILCQSVESQVKREGQTIDINDLGDLEAVTGGYYEKQLQLLGDEASQLAARRLIEEGLVFEEEERRLSLYEGQIFRVYGITPAQLRALVDAHLLRAEPSLQGGYTYELSHDTLVAPVLEAKHKRQSAEKEAREAEIRRQQEAAVAAARSEAAKERRRRVFSNILAGVAVVGLIIAYWQYRAATQAQEAAKTAQTEAEAERDKTAASLRDLQAEKARALVRDGDSFVQEGEYGYAFSKYREALTLKPGDPEIAQKIRRCEEELTPK